MKKKLKDYDDVLSYYNKDIVKYDRARVKRYPGSHLSYCKNLTGFWDDWGSTRSGWKFFWNWFDSRVGRDAIEVRKEFNTCKKWNDKYFIGQKWRRFVNDRWVIDTLDRAHYYIDDNGIFQKYE